jgi:hypothetical protein
MGVPLRHADEEPGWGVRFVGFSEDGKTAYTVCTKGRVWDVETCKPLGAPYYQPITIDDAERARIGALAGASWIAFQPSGNHVLCSSGNRAQLFSIPSPMQGPENAIQKWVEVSTGMEIIPGRKEFRFLERSEWAQRRDQLQATGFSPQ